MNCSRLQGLSLSQVGKRSVFKLAVDLVKADKRIHSDEIEFLDSLQEILGLPQEDLDMIHYTSLQGAVHSLSEYDDIVKDAVISFLAGLMKSDSDIDFEEDVLFTAVNMVLSKKSREWCTIVTALDCMTDVPSKQIIYLEKQICAEPRKVLDDKYDNLLILKTLSDVGFDLFYLPNVLDGIEHNDDKDSGFCLLQRSMEYLIPAGDKKKITNLAEELESLDIRTFSSIVLSGFSIRHDTIPYEAFLLVKIRESRLLDDNNDAHKASDFLCIDVSKNVKYRILEFVAGLDQRSRMISYEGYYKILYDYLSSESKTKSRIVLDSNFDFKLIDLDGHKMFFESSPQARTFYLLMLRYGNSGISRNCFNAAVTYLESIIAPLSSGEMAGPVDVYEFLTLLKNNGDSVSVLIYNTITIYGVVSTKDIQSPKFFTYVLSILKHRSSLKNYINNGFMTVPKLSARNEYCVQFEKESGTYYLPLSLSNIIVEIPGGYGELKSTPFWASLL